MNTPSRPPITDSPWFWVYVFATSALVALVLIAHQYDKRQVRLERQYQARERAGQVTVRDASDDSLSESGDTIIRLKPLYMVTGLTALFGWVLLWWSHFRKSSRGKSPGQASNSGAKA